MNQRKPKIGLASSVSRYDISLNAYRLFIGISPDNVPILGQGTSLLIDIFKIRCYSPQ